MFDKLVTRQRGGYCFEQNRLLQDALAALGVECRPLLARVMLRWKDGDPSPPRSHVCLLGHLEGGHFIVDAGFGGNAMPLLPLEPGRETYGVDGSAFRLCRVGDPGSLPGEWLVERRAMARNEVLEPWRPLYAFNLDQVADADLAVANHAASTMPSMRFTSVHFVSIALADGLASLTERELVIRRAGGEQRRTIADADDYAMVLRDVFRLSVSKEEIERLPLFADASA